MTEWGVVLVIVTLAGLVAAVTGPVVRLNSNITRLAALLERQDEDLDELTNKNHEAHARLWDHNKAQDAAAGARDNVLAGHEVRITNLEGKKHG